LDGEDRQFSGTVRPTCDMKLDQSATLLICVREVSVKDFGFGGKYSGLFRGFT